MSESKQLVIQGPAGEKIFSHTSSPILIGRSSTAHIRYNESFISRNHLEILWNGVTWHIQVSSTRGIYDANGSKLPDLVTIESPLEIRLALKEGPALSVRVEESDALPETKTESETKPSRYFDEPTTTTVAKNPFPQKSIDFPKKTPTVKPVSPGNDIQHQPVRQPPPAVSNRPSQPAPRSRQKASSPEAVQVIVNNENYFFEPGTVVTVGRDPDSLVKIAEDHSLVSRKHLQIVHQNGQWHLHDSSSKGTFIRGKQIQANRIAIGTEVAYLGDPQTGAPITIITPTSSESHDSSKTPLILGAVALVVLITVVWLGLFFNREDPFDIENAKKSTVLLLGGTNEEGTFAPTQVGTGFFVSDDLILTNQHTSVGQLLLVGVTRTPDEPAVIEYAATKVSNHPFLDVALLKVDERAIIEDGLIKKTPLTSVINLPAVDLGDSNELRTGDKALSIGFPQSLDRNAFSTMNSITTQVSLSVVEGGFANVKRWPACSAAAPEKSFLTKLPEGVTCSQDGNISKAIAISTFASGRGASGSPVYRDGKVIAIVFAGPSDNANSSYSITTAAFSDWLQKEITRNG